MNKKILLIIFLISRFTFAQTTVTLEDQCNCEVLQGTDVATAGAVTPIGADLGDLYVNTTTGTIYFWDGDSWELTSSDSNTTNDRIEIVGTDLVITDSDTNTISIPLADIAAQVNTNTSITSFEIDATDTNLVLTDSEGTDFSILLSDIAALVDTDNQTLENFQVNGANLELGISNGNTVSVPLNTIDTDTQYTAGNGLNLDGSNEFTAVASPDADNALDVRANGIYATDTDDQNAGEVNFDDTAATLGETDVQGAIEALAGRTDNDTQYTAGNGLNLDGSNEFTAVASPDANNALDVRANGIYAIDTDNQNAGEVTIADTGNNFTGGTVEAALEELATATDNDTQYTAGNGLNLDGSNEFTAVASPDADNALDVRSNGIYATDTDDQTAAEVTVADTAGNFTNNEVEGVLEEIDARIDALVLAGGSDGNDFVTGGSLSGTDLTLNVPNQIDPVIDLSGLEYTAGNGLNLDGSNEFTAVASPDANNALDVRANGIYATDDQNAGEVSFDDTAATLGETDVQGAIEALAGRTDNDTQYTAGNGLNLDGSNEFTAVASPDADNALDVRANGIYATDTDDQNAGEVNFDDTAATLGETDVQGAIEALAGRTDNDTQYTAGNGLNLDGSNEFTAVASPDANNALDVRANGIYATDTDNQNAGEVTIADTGNNFTGGTVEAALEELATATDNDTQYTAGNGLNLDGSNEFTAVASPDADNALDVRANGIYATDNDDQNAGEVSFDDTAATLGETDVQGAIEALAGRTDNDTQYTAGNGLNLDGSNEFTAAISGNAGNALSIVGGELFATDTDTQYTAGNGLNLDGSNEFTAVASPDANNALDVRANGIYATDDQNAGEVSFDDTAATLGETDVQGAIEALAGRTDNDTQYTAGDGLALDGSNEFTAAISGNAGNALSVVGGELFATDTDDQNASEVSIVDTDGNFTSGNVEGALDELADSITANIADGTETIITEGTDIEVTGDGSAGDPYVINNVRPNIFYPPSIAIDVSAYTGTPILNQTIDLHAQYIAQYGSPMVRSDVGGGDEAPAAIPTYTSGDLYYYVTFFDNSVFDNVEVNANGVMEYDIIGAPADYNSLINVVFVVK